MPDHPQRLLPVRVAGCCAVLFVALLGGSACGGVARRLPKRPGGKAPAKPDRSPDFRLTVAAGLSGYCRMGWFPVHVAIEAGREFEGHVVAALRLGPRRPILFETRRKIKLAANSKKDYHLYLRHESVHLGQGQVVEVYLDDGRPVPKTNEIQNIQLVPETKYLVCVVAEGRRLLGGITGQKGKAAVNGSPLAGGYSWEFKVAQPQLRSLPDRAAGYNGVDFLVLYQTPLEVSKLSIEKLDAIIDFARGGGVVLLSAGDRAWFERPELRPLVRFNRVSATPKDETTTLLTRLERRYGAKFLGRSRNMTTLDFKAQGFAADPTKGLVAGPCGLGRALVWRINLQDPSVRNWAGMYNFWADLGLRQYPNKPRDDYSYGYGYNPENNPFNRALQRTEILNLAQERSVSAWLVTFIVILYLVLVGPVNYFVLRRLDMRALSIVTIPLLSAVFVLITFAVGYISRGVTTVGRRVTVASVYSGGTRARSVTSQSVFPAGSMLVDIGTDGHGLICALQRSQMGGQQQRCYATMNDDGFILERYPLNMWEMAHFEAISTRSLGGTITLEALTGSGGRTDGRYRLVNRSAIKLEEAFVVSGRAGGKFAWIGDVERGKAYTGKVARWQQTSEREEVRRPRRAPSLTMRHALKLWIRKALGGKTSYAIARSDDSFSEQAASVMLKDARLDPAIVTVRTGMTLFAKVRNADEFEPIKLDGGSIRGESVNALVVFSERGGSQ